MWPQLSARANTRRQIAATLWNQPSRQIVLAMIIIIKKNDLQIVFLGSVGSWQADW
jgi:hypothetical protein